MLGIVLVSMVLWAGCVPTGDGGNSNTNGGTGNDNETAATRIVSPRTSFAVSRLSPAISVVYTVEGDPELISGYYVRVDAGPGNERVIIDTGLPAGTNQQFLFRPKDVEVGSYKVGILIQEGTDSTPIESDAVIEVQGPPDPVFIQPTGDTQVVVGGTVPIAFDAGDPENNVQWRLFYLAEGDPEGVPANQLGTQLAVGVGNVGQAVFATTGLDLGDYRLGLSATDSGLSVAATVSRTGDEQIETELGPTVQVVQQRLPMPPTIAITAPANSDVTVFRNDPFTIQFTATIREEGATGLVDLFYDTDANFNNGFTLIVDNLPASMTSYPWPSNVAEGTYRVGASVRDGINPVVFTYAVGEVMVVRTPTLDVTEPNSDLPIPPASLTGVPVTVPVRWTTNVPAGPGRTVDVYAQTLDITGSPFGPEIEVLAPRPLTVTSANFSSATPGVYAIVIRIRLTSNATAADQVLDESPKPVRVSSLPRILWLGSLAADEPAFEGAIFQGVNFEDNAGTSFTTVGDLDGDNLDEFVISARYGKPFFVNPTGIGPGEAYLVYGGSGGQKLRGEFNLNSLGVTFRGVNFTGIRTPQASNETDGMSSVSRIPDVDNDGADELLFGFPNTESRGHNIDPQQDGVVEPRSLQTLEREGQFLRGGIVIVSSQNDALSDTRIRDIAINLDVVGQNFDIVCMDREPTADAAQGAFALDVHSAVNPQTQMGCAGSCQTPMGGGKPDATLYIDHGFVSALARDYFRTYVYSWHFYGGTNFCPSVVPFLDHECLELIDFVPHEYCNQFVSSCEPFSPGLHAAAIDPDGFVDPFGLPTFTRLSGYYPAFVPVGTGTDNVVPNDPLEPLGARIIGVGFGDRFGTSATLANLRATGAGDIIVSAPERTGRGVLLGQFPSGCIDPPSCGGEIDGLESAPGSPKTNPNSGVAYLFALRSLWTQDSAGRFPPKPHQYIVGEASHCSGPIDLIPNIDALRIVGAAGDRITNISGIDDFNDDGLNDFAVGAPDANGGQGRVYVAFRRTAAIEGDYVLEKLSLDPNSPDRLTGALIVTGSLDGLGSSLASGVDFNGDDLSDLVIGSPNASNGVGEVIVVFGDANLVSPMNGVSVQTLLNTRDALGRPRAARITGNSRDTNGRFGFNIANAGDVDGDGLDDLLIAAPNASPRFDPDPTNAMDVLSEAGLDSNFDGLKDDVSGPFGSPDGRVDMRDDLAQAGIVYVISSRNRLDEIPRANVTVSVSELGSSLLRGFMIVGRRSGDRIGGGDAGDTSQGGITAKVGRGRSKGLASAGDVDGDQRADILIGSVLADPRVDPNTGVGVQNGGEAYLIYSSAVP